MRSKLFAMKPDVACGALPEEGRRPPCADRLGERTRGPLPEVIPQLSPTARRQAAGSSPALWHLETAAGRDSAAVGRRAAAWIRTRLARAGPLSLPQNWPISSLGRVPLGGGFVSALPGELPAVSPGFRRGRVAGSGGRRRTPAPILTTRRPPRGLRRRPVPDRLRPPRAGRGCDAGARLRRSASTGGGGRRPAAMVRSTAPPQCRGRCAPPCVAGIRAPPARTPRRGDLPPARSCVRAGHTGARRRAGSGRLRPVAERGQRPRHVRLVDSAQWGQQLSPGRV